jgi:TrmH family RNA methyltransferase
MSRLESITSAANPLIKDVRRAIARGGLTDQGWCVAETFHLLSEALRSSLCDIKAILVSETARPTVETQLGDRPNLKLTVLPDPLFQSISGTHTAQGVMTLVRPPEWKWEQLFDGCPLLLLLDAIQDPGNAGTIARAAEAFGATGVLFLEGSVSPWNPKTLRASAGSLLRLPLLHGLDSEMTLAWLRDRRLRIYAGVPSGAPAVSHVDLKQPCAFIIGSEAHGVSDAWSAAAAPITIPTSGVESLNAAMAAAILLYETRRQRMPAA